MLPHAVCYIAVTTAVSVDFFSSLSVHDIIMSSQHLEFKELKGNTAPRERERGRNKRESAQRERLRREHSERETTQRENTVVERV